MFLYGSYTLSITMSKLACSFLGLLFALVASWLAIWGANIFLFILSLPLSLIDVIFIESGWFVCFLYYAIKTGFVYWGATFVCFHKGYRLINQEHHLLDFVMLPLLAFLVISFSDPNVANSLPGFMMTAQNWLHESCNYYLMGGMDWANFCIGDVPDMQYIVFDIAVGIAAIFTLIVPDLGN